MHRHYLTSTFALLLTSAIAQAALPGRTDTSFPLSGQQETLVILVEFEGTPFNVEDPFGYFNGILTQDDFTDYFSKGSCQQYFRENSDGRFEPKFDVYGPVVLPHKASYYGVNINNVYDPNAHEMVTDACDILDDDIDFTIYDTNGDGIVDNVFIVYAGYGEASGGGADTVWPHAAFISKKVETPVIHDGVQIDRYACVNEMEKDYPTGIGTFCHEFSHVLGLPDIYTTDQAKRYTTGSWDLMDHGSLNGNQRRPCNLTAYERSVLGWLEPEEITPGHTYTLPPLDENLAYILPTESPSEFFIFENRQTQGWDKGLSGHGLVVWHIDYQEDKWADNTVNNDPSHPCVDIVKADGHASDGSEAGDPFPGSAGKCEISFSTTEGFRTWNGNSPGIVIRDITENKDKSVTFRVETDESYVGLTEKDNIRIEGKNISAPFPFTITDVSGRVIETGVSDVTTPCTGIFILHTKDMTKKIIIK